MHGKLFPTLCSYACTSVDALNVENLREIRQVLTLIAFLMDYISVYAEPCKISIRLM